MAECNFISPLIPKENIQGAHRGIGHISHDMGIDHGGLDILMTQKLLHFSDVDPVHEEMGGKTVSEGVHGSMLWNGSLFERHTYCGLDCLIADMMAPYSVPAGNCEGNHENRAIPLSNSHAS